MRALRRKLSEREKVNAFFKETKCLSDIKKSQREAGTPEDQMDTPEVLASKEELKRIFGLMKMKTRQGLVHALEAAMIQSGAEEPPK